MYKFLKRNNKKLLAVFAAFLMVVFILPSTFKGGGQQTNAVLGTIGGGATGYDPIKIRATEYRDAKEEWDLLSRLPSAQLFGQYPMTFIISGFDSAIMALQMQTKPPVTAQIDAHQEMFLLLVKEAERMGVQVSSDRLETVLHNDVRLPENASDEQLNGIRRALRSFLMVQGAFERAASVVKVSEPMRRHGMAEHFQSIKVDVVELPVSDFKGGIEAPNAEQMQQQFSKFADRPPKSYDPAMNPLGFGYLYPNRVKLQYIAIPREELRQAVRKAKNDYEWKVRAFEYYSENQTLFPTTQPTAAPSTQQGGFDLGSSPTTQTAGKPTTRPFEEVREEIMTRLVRTDADRLAAAVQDKINAQLAADWVAYQKAVGSAPPTTAPASGSPTSQPTTSPAPATALGVPYDTFDYLKRLAEKIQRENGVLPTVVSIPDFKSMDELAELPGIGKASAARLTFPQYAAGLAEAFVPPTMRDNPRLLKVFSPSLPLKDDEETTYIFRLTAADPSHKPSDPTEVLTKLREDVITATAYAKAKSAADELLKSAKEVGLDSAAQTAKRTVITAGPFRGPGDPIPNYTLPDEQARIAFAIEASKLLKQSGSDQHPLGLIELPQAGRVLVARLADVKPAWDSDNQFMVEMQITQQMTSELERLVQNEWYSYPSLVARLNYQQENPGSSKSSSNQPSPPPAPPPLGL